jgi:hypothetical protein
MHRAILCDFSLLSINPGPVAVDMFCQADCTVKRTSKRSIDALQGVIPASGNRGASRPI